MTTTDTERYVRLSLLTYKGGKWIGSEILKREVDHSPYNTIDEILKQHRPSLQRKRDNKELSNKHFLIIFPVGGGNTCQDDWDVQLVIKVILYLFGTSISGLEKQNLGEILSIRNELISHAGDPSINETRFVANLGKLTGFLYGLASSLGPTMIMPASELITSFTSGPLDLKSSIDKLAELCRQDEHMENVLESLWRIERDQHVITRRLLSIENKMDDVLAKLDTLKDKQEIGAPCKVEIPMLQNKVFIGCQTEEPVKLAKDILLAFMSNAERRAEDPENERNLREAVDQYLEELRADDSDVVNATDGSITVHIRCRSIEGLYRLLKKFAMNLNRIRLVRIENALNDRFSEEFQVYTAFPEETINSLLSWIDDCLKPTQGEKEVEQQYHREELTLDIQCHSVEAVARVTDYFQNGQAANSLNTISEALSSCVNDTIRVDASLNIEGFSAAVDARYGNQDVGTRQYDTSSREKTHEITKGTVDKDDIIVAAATKDITEAVVEPKTPGEPTMEGILETPVNEPIEKVTIAPGIVTTTDIPMKEDVSGVPLDYTVPTIENVAGSTIEAGSLAPQTKSDQKEGRGETTKQDLSTENDTILDSSLSAPGRQDVIKGIQHIHITQEKAKSDDSTSSDTTVSSETVESEDVESLNPDSLNMDEYVVLDKWNETDSSPDNGQNKRKKDTKGTSKRQKMNDGSQTDQPFVVLAVEGESIVDDASNESIETDTGKKAKESEDTVQNKDTMNLDKQSSDILHMDDKNKTDISLQSQEGQNNQDQDTSQQGDENQDEAMEQGDSFYDAPTSFEETESTPTKIKPISFNVKPVTEHVKVTGFVFGIGGQAPRAIQSTCVDTGERLFQTDNTQQPDHGQPNTSTDLPLDKPDLLECGDDQRNPIISQAKKPNKNKNVDKSDFETSSSDSDSSMEETRPRTRRQRRNAAKRTDNQSNEQTTVKERYVGDANIDQPPRTRSSLKFYEKKIKVHFHVFVDEAFKFSLKDRKLVLRSDIFHGWYINGPQLRLKRKWIEGKVFEMETVVELPLHQVYGEKGRFYKYFILKKGEKGEYEKYWVDKKLMYHNQHQNRSLVVPYKFKDKEVWHQYDGFIERSPKTKFGRIKYYVGWNDILKHMKMSTYAFANLIFLDINDGYSVEEAMDKFTMMFTCIRKIYYVDAKRWNTDQDFAQEFGEIVLKIHLDNLGRDRKELELAKSVVCVLLLSTTLSSYNLSQDIVKKLCFSLLLPPDTDCTALKITEKFFPWKSSKEIKQALVNLVRNGSRLAKDPIWLFVMPWIHFLSESCVPYETPEVDLAHDYRVPRWWGISHIGEDTVKQFKERFADWTIPLRSVIHNLYPLFDMDYLLPRTLMSVIELKHLKEAIETGLFPVEVSLATLNYYVKIYLPRTAWAQYSADEDKLLESAEALLNQIEITKCSGKHKSQMEMSYRISVGVLDHVTLSNRSVIVYTIARIVANCIAIYDAHTDQNKETHKEQEHFRVLIKCTETMGYWFRQNFINWSHYLSEFLQIWNKTLVDKISSETVCTMWNDAVLSTLSTTLQAQVCRYSGITEEFVKLFCETGDTFHPKMQDVLSKTAFEAISVGYDFDYMGFTEQANKQYGLLLSNMFNAEWEKAIRKDAIRDQDQILRHVLRYRPFLRFLKIYNQEQQKLMLLNEECWTRIALAVSDIDSKLRELMNGTLSVGTLTLISAPGSMFCEVAIEASTRSMEDPESTKVLILKAMVVRQKEMEFFKEQAAHLTSLTSLCQHLGNVDIDAIDEVLRKQGDIENFRLSEFIKPVDVDTVQNVETFRPASCMIPLPSDMLAILPDITRCYDSSMFLTFWEHKCREQAGKMAVVDVIHRVWEPVKDSWDKKAREIASGTITFQSMENVIGHLYQDDYGKMREELRTLGLRDDVINTRIDQLREYRQLETCVKGARIILNFSKEYKLAGNFIDIENIARYGQSVIQMKSFDRTLIKTCEFLKHLGDDKAECLETFVYCGPLVTWLKESMKSGLKELKVFVDLAMMSAGEEPMNIKRVQCLHSAVTGYGPLIFDLKQTADNKMLLSRCELVWRELAANPKLPIQLRDTNRNLEWLKDVKKAHGSVEVTSMFQADAINSNGIYTVGLGAWKVVTDSNAQDISSVLKLTVPEEEGKRQRRNYNLAQLQDLQSRLMLVAGKADKGSEGVEIFTSVFDSIMRLSNVYKKLCASGCVLYKEWTARFFCLNKRELCTVLEFGQSEDVPKLKGLRNENEDLREFVPKIANYMESCYDDWLNYIKDKRREYLHLNYFTVDQLVILQKELVKCGTDEEPSHFIYPLLSAIKNDCTPEDLLAAMAEAKDILDSADAMETEIEKEDISEDKLDQIQRQKFIQEIIDAGYSQELAIKALDHIPVDDIDEGIVWCMDHSDEDDENMTDPDDMTVHGPGTSSLSSTGTSTTSLGFTGWNLDTQSSMQSMIANNIRNICGMRRGTGVKPLLEELQLLWKEFLGSISSNVKDYLSLEHLGLILRCLSNKESSSIERLFPHGYQEGTPNLLICPSGDVLPMVLTLYMLTKIQPLPQSDEVLLCTANTTLDEVDIFWRRALYGNVRKIYCLVNADMLDYEVSDKAEKCLEEYLQSGTVDQPYRLVVICGSENEYRSRIVSSLDKHSRTPLPVIPTEIQKYLATKLQVPEQFGGISPAAFVDVKRSSVRLVKSLRPGVGKTLYKERKEAELAKLNPDLYVDNVTIPLQMKSIDQHRVLKTLLEHSSPPGKPHPRIFHIDVAHEVQHGVDYLLFNLLVLGCVMDKTGYVWRKSQSDLYLIETMPLMFLSGSHKSKDVEYAHKMLSLLPDMTCRSPQESLTIYTQSARQPKNYRPHDQLFDELQFSSTHFQRPFQYLYRHDQGKSLTDINPDEPEGDPQTCLQTLLKHCGVQDPSWAELHHFVWFLNTQLQNSENSNYMCAAAGEDEFLPGFSKFVLRFMIQMSRDFSTRSLNMSEESPGLQYEGDHMDMDEDNLVEEEVDVLQQLQMRRTWESSPHPYLFFNYGGHTFTFLGFQIHRKTGNLIDLQTKEVLEERIMSTPLYDSLVHNGAPLQEDFEKLKRHERIQKMCNVMGIENPHDPDDTYELTTDNVKKIMAIFMRFRCDIPVIIMGETGCGKTRLVKFMCSLQMPPGLAVSNMVLMKVHGGTTNADIKKKVEEAEKLAIENVDKYGKQMYTVLFFDEANTTESIGLIKEIMCDKSMEGRKLKLSENLKIVAACNPYRKHSDDLIKKLEQAGLGYHVDAEETSDKLGRVPMRRLVYRVQPLPQSLLPLVWDFGQLNTQVEDLYIRQMVRRYIREDKLPNITGLVNVMSSILTASQGFMRLQNDECSFVSLRDVDRVLGVMSWFYSQSQGNRTLFKAMDKLWLDSEIEDGDDIVDEDDFEDAEEDMDTPYEALDDVTRSLVLALGVCYHACLRDRQQYREHIQQYFQRPCQLPGGADRMEKEILFCQDVFLDNVILQKNIAKNMALKENVFMMVVCIELRIPLFLVGKPGSSKSLAKTIVSDAMHGNASHKKLFQELKQAQMVSFQCSPLSTPESIVSTFRQCAQFQKDKDLNGFVSIVVLDEVGLAEDSPRMPLKTLHPLLEDGCQGDETPEQYKKVAFIGISNWALDPAKMNRGILVQREVPDLLELKNSARGICWTKHGKVLSRIEHLIEPMAVAYLQLFEEASKQMREFYGLRDFYSIVKMVFAFAERSKQKPTWYEMVHAIKRNFGGLDQIDPVASFKANLSKVMPVSDKPKPTDPDCSPAGLIHACLFDTSKTKSVSRYLLLLTENYSALSILEQEILTNQSDIRPITIFGSSFRRDQEYTQVCRNINKIKVCMETGNTVVLLNLENLYESLYDALNQYYEYFGGERYVDLGLGTHRVKCPVHKDFRLIVVAEKQIVYKKFPIPLINRLEKHFLTLSNMLSPEQLMLVKRLEEWAQNFVKQNVVIPLYKRNEKVPVTKVNDGFMGYHDDTCSAIVIHVWKTFATMQEDYKSEDVFQATKEMLLWCATPDAVVRLDKSSIPADEAQQLKEIYFQKQTHDNIAQYLHHKLLVEGQDQLLAQVTTHSKLLATFHRTELSRVTELPIEQITLLDTLSSFDTEQQFSNKIKQHFKDCGKNASLLLVQCDSGDVNASLVACARYSVMDEIERMREEIRAPVHVVFIVQLPNLAAGCFSGFQCGAWHSVHIDELWSTEWEMPTVLEMQGKSVATLFHSAVLPALDSTNFTPNEPVSLGEMTMDWDEPVASTSSADTDMQTRLSDVAKPGAYRMDTTTPLKVGGIGGSLERVGQTSVPGKHLNVRGLVLSCVQSAMAMVKDKEENAARTTERVRMVLQLFHQKTGDEGFLHGVCSLIGSLLKDKEIKEYGGYLANQWLVNEAAKTENIQKAGTFRKACLQTLEAKISPILAGIIAYLDTNQNLDLLQDGPSINSDTLHGKVLAWKQTFALAVVNTKDAIPLKYSDLQSPKRHSNLTEVIVMTTGYEGQMFVSRMPFSWLIHKQLYDVLKVPVPRNEEEGAGELSLTDKIQYYIGVMCNSAYGKLLDTQLHYEIEQELIDDYISDFVYILYKVGTQEEHMLVHQSIRTVTNQMLEQLPEVKLLHRLVCVHLAYQQLTTRLGFFHAMNCVWPECSLAIVHVKHTNPDHYMFKEEDLTFGALCLLIENLDPGKNSLNVPENQTKWLQKVHTYRHVVEKVLGYQTEETEADMPHNHISQIRARCLWTRVVVVKLFLEHVCVAGEKEKIAMKHCMSLWKVLREETNMKKLHSMDALEKFLKTCNRLARKEFIGNEDKCCQCESTLEGPPMVLPCGHILCDACLCDLRALDDNVCPKCKKAFDRNWTPEKQTQDSEAFKKMREYQKRCNSFFMDIVSQLCFSNNSPPENEVVEKLVKYVLCQRPNSMAGRQGVKITKEMGIFETGLDPNPVFRSFLLQLLMRTSQETAYSNLELYLKKAEDYIDSEDVDRDQQYKQLCLLVMQCFEDMLLEETVSSKQGPVVIGAEFLRNAVEFINEQSLDVQKLRALAETRVGLGICASQIANIIKKKLNISQQDPKVRRLIEAAQLICEEGESKWPRIYLIKYLCRSFGIDVYKALCKSEKLYLRWITITNLVDDKRIEGPDRYVCCGDLYINIREALTKVILGESAQHLIDTLKEMMVAGGHVEIMLRLAVHREITCSYLYPEGERNVNQTVISTLEEHVLQSDVVKNKELFQALLHNGLGADHLTVNQEEDHARQGLQCLLQHFISVLADLKGLRTLMQPFLTLLRHPEQSKEFYLPTMPQDDLDELREALLAARKENEDYNPLFYRCPNGHPYVIGNCGRPVDRAQCKDCGADIGGEGYNKLIAGNVVDQGVDQTRKGHVLGRAEGRGKGPKPERTLRPASCACLRLLTHMSMYLGTVSNKQAIQSIITPDLEEEEVPEFLWQHILFDLEDLQRGLGRSLDDVLLVIHAVINDIMIKHKPADIGLRDDHIQLSTKLGRKEWEDRFSTAYIQPVLQGVDDLLTKLNNSITQDSRLGGDPLLCLLYETGSHQDTVELGMLQDLPDVWRYRTPISIDHLTHELETQVTGGLQQQSYPVLQLFLKEDHYLRAIRHVPNILKLQRHLFHKYQRRLDKAEATTITIGRLKQDDSGIADIRELIDSFGEAWEVVREVLPMYMFPTELGGMVVSKEYCSHPMTDNTPIAILLPSLKEMGLCSYGLLDFLFRKQNDFLDKYITASKRSLRSVSKVSPMDVTPVHLISYEPQQDLLPMVLANCKYSFEMGKGTKVEYDFEGLEKQLMDRFLFSKSRIDIQGTLQIEQMVFKAEITDSAVFKNLAEKIPQEGLTAAVKSQIGSELKTLPDICSSMDNLDITISFLTSVSGDPEHNLNEFMVNTLKMENSLKSQKAKQECRFKHTKSLWLLLALLKSKQLADHQQPRESLFETVELDFNEDLPDAVQDELVEYLKQQSIDTVSHLVELIHEYIVIRVAVRENPDDEDYTDKRDNRLMESLYAYVEAMERPSIDPQILGNFPADILHRHSSHTWAETYKMLQVKLNGHRLY